ncbi:MAG: carboxypeptidase regulatory-like domain-containing protein [Acidobacteriota bacterium]
MNRFSRMKGLAISASLLFIITLVLPFTTPVVIAQSSKGIVVGTVTDPTGAAISGGTIKITNISTNVSRETALTPEGTFRLDAVDPGTYKIEIKADGFKTAVKENVTIAAAQTTDTSFTLEVGGSSEVVNVNTDSGVILQKQDGTRANTLDPRQIVDLPVGALNPANLVFTLPGVVAPGVLAGGFVQGTEFSINGLRPRANNQLLDGTDNNDNAITGQFYLPILRDGYREVSVLGANNSAEYGRAGGAVVNLVTRNGTNQFHGSVYDVITSSALASLSNGQKVNEGLTSVPVSIANNYGFSIGGPIKKDRLFFFGTFQASPFRSTTTASAVVPTAEGFATLRSLFPQGSSANLDRYLGIVGDLRGITNVIQIPLGGNRQNIPFATATLTGISQRVDDYQFLTRVDWALGAKDVLAFRYVFDDQLFKNQIPSAFQGFGIDAPSRVQNFYASHTRTLSPKLLNEFRFSYGRFNAAFNPQDPATLNSPQFVFGATNIASVGLSATFPQSRIFNNYQFQDTITYTIGDHTIRAGVDLLRQIAKENVPFNGRGSLTFSTGGGFPAFGNFVDGFSGTQGVFASRVFGNPVIFPDAFQQSYFVNDSWRVTANLTLNLGLRYENYGTPFNVIQFPAFAGFDAPLDTVVRQQRDNNNFAPRFSFAYTPRFATWLFGADKTVIRGGYGISYDVFFNNILDNTAASSPNAFGVTTLGSTAGGRGFANAGENSLPTTGAPNPFAGITSVDANLVNPLTHLWNLGVQRQAPGNVIVDVAYVGSRGTRLLINEQLNPGVDGVRIFSTRGPVTLRTNGGDSLYHSLQTRVERGLHKGVLARFAYTYSKTIDNVNSEVFVTTGGSSVGSNPFDRSVDRSVASFDVPHSAVWSFIWDVPGPARGLLGEVAGGWTLSGIYRIQSGAVESPFVGGIDLNGDLNSFNDRPTLGNPNAPATSVAFANSLFGFLGNGFVDLDGKPIDPANARFLVDPANRVHLAGRNTLRGNRVNSFDASVNKAFHLPFEGHRLEIRVDFFNLFNHANFSFANPGISSDLSNGDVTNPFFNNVRLNDGGNRTGRIQVRYAF